jgi:hypothetical protein
VISGASFYSPRIRRLYSSIISSAMLVRESRTSSANGAFGRVGNGHRTTRNALSRLTGVPRIEAIFRAHLGDERKILAASDQTDDG